MATYGDGTRYGDGTVYGATLLDGAAGVATADAVRRLDDRIEYFRPDTSESLPIYLVRPGAELLMSGDPEGLDAAPSSPVASATPRQFGTTVNATVKGHRVISTRFHARASSVEEARSLRGRVAEALHVPQSRAGERPALGHLHVIRNGRPALEIDAVPVDESPRLVGRLSPTTVLLAADFYCPDPRFREVALAGTIMLGAPVPGFQFPLTFPFSLPSRNDVADVVNDGVAAPVFVEFRGEVTGAVLTLESPAGEVVETLAVDGTIDDGDRLVVDRGVVTLRHPDGSSEDGWDLLEPVDSQPFDLPSGAWRFRLTADSMPSGSVRVVWHRHWPSA